MPRLYIKMTEKDGTEIECNASGWFILGLSFSNQPRMRLRKLTKEYGIQEKEK